MNTKVQMLQSYLVGKPKDRFARYSLAMELVKQGHFSDAEGHFRQVIVDHPLSGATYYHLAAMLGSLSREEEASVIIQQGLTALTGRTDPDSRRSFHELEDLQDDLEG